MKLNHDCVRDVLLAIEEKATLTDYLTETSLFSSEHLKEYGADELYYTLLKIKEADFINGDVMVLHDLRTLVIKSLTYEGHSFLDNIRDEDVWKGAKAKASSTVSSVSIAVMGQLASAYIKTKLGLT